mgnify:CR=1 FL=1
MNKKPFGLNIGITSIKVVWLSSLKEGFLLDASIISPAPAKGMLSESPLDQEEMARTIETAVANAKIVSKFVNVALPENQVYTKVIEMPILSDKELSSAIFWEAEQNIPVPLSTITLAWNVLKRPQKAIGNEKMHVLMVGAPSVLVNKYQKVLLMAGLRINALETELLSIIRALVLSENFPPSIIINIGSISTSLAIIRNGIMIFTYSIPTGGIAINRAISTDFGLTPTQAEEYKKIYGISKEAFGGKIGKAIEPILNSILAEVKKSLVFYSEKYKDDKPIRQVLLTGGTAKLPGIDLFFTNNTGIETAIANPWKIILNQNELPQQVLDNGPDYTIAVGLAMRDNEN